MRMTVGPLPAAVYWRRRAVVAVALALVTMLFASMCGGPDQGKPNGQPSPSGSSLITIPGTSGSPSGDPATSPTADAGPGTGDGVTGDGITGVGATAGPPASDDGATGNNGGVPAGPPVVASVPCADAEIALTAEVSPSPGVYGGVITLTLVVRNIADHACLRDVGSAPQELQVRQGAALVWSSDHCDTPQASDVRAFGPNIESRFSRRWNTYRVAPNECAPPSGGLPAGRGSYQVVARLGDKFSDPVPFEIR